MNRIGNRTAVWPADNISPAILETLRKSALSRGADDAVIIHANDVIVDPRVRLKCMIPKCYMSGGCAHCPPHGYSIREVRDIVDGFNWGVFFRVRVKNSIVAAGNIHRAIESGVADQKGNLLNLGAHHFLIFTIAKVLEKRARKGGYSARSFAAGNCHGPLCLLQSACRRLTTTSTGCRNPSLSAPSMEACGMDVFRMAARVGWDHYPIGGSCEPDSIPYGNLMGLVLVGEKR